MTDVSVSVSHGVWHEARAQLFTPDGAENAGVFMCGLSKTPRRNRLLVREYVPVPSAAYLARQAYHLEIAPAFYNEIVTRSERTGLHPLLVHSHPMHGDVWYSRSDDAGELRLLNVLNELLPERIVGSVVVSYDDAIGRRLINGTFSAISEVRVIGQSTQMFRRPAGKGNLPQERRYDRQVRAFGSERQAFLEEMNVGIVGLGGTGSVVAEQVARLGAGSLILIDDDCIDATNLSRVLGSNDASIGEPKAEVAAANIRRFSTAAITPVSESAIHQSVLKRLTECDIVFGCVDNDSTRALLNRFAYQYLIPVIDMGVRIDARSGRVDAAAGRVSVVGPDMTCLRCSHHLNAERIRAESMSRDERERLRSEGYIMGIDDPVPAVITLNVVISGLAATAFANLFIGITGGVQPATQIYDATTGSVFPTSAIHELGCDVCDRKQGVLALGDAQIVSAY